MSIELASGLVIAERFRLERPLGQGGMGSVWEATHLGLETACAIKFIHGDHAGSSEAHARFQREAKASALLRSPHVVQVLDHGVFEGMPYIAMELLDGEDLGRRLRRVGRLRPLEAVVVATHVARALTKAHAAGIVHRDLKPENVFLVADDDGEIAKVVDFGIAKAGLAFDASTTKSGAVLGTPSYMSPEQAQGTKTVDHRSDLWSLAVIVYQCLTGRLPFESEALGDLFLKIMVEPIPTMAGVAPELPAEIDAWWLRAAARDPEQRFQSAKELADALARVFEGAPATATRESHAGRAPSRLPTLAPTSATSPGRAPRVATQRPAARYVVAGAVLVGAIAVLALALTLRTPRPPAERPAAFVAPPAHVELPAPSTSVEPVPAPVPVTITAIAPPPPVAASASPRQAPPKAPRPAASAKPAAGAKPAPSAGTPPRPAASSPNGGGPNELWSAIKSSLGK